MSKLKVIQDRREDLSHEADLRGLGQDPLLTQITPTPELTISGDDSVLKSLSDKYGRHFSALTITHTEANQLKVFSHSKHGNFKEDLVELFGFALAISHKSQTADIAMDLDIKDNFRAKMLNSEGQKHSDSAEMIWDSYCRISSACTIYLNQAGFSIQRSQHSLSLSHREIEDIYKTSTSAANTESTKLGKVG